MVGNWKRNAKRRLKGLCGEEREQEIANIRQEQELAYWRREVLKAYRDKQEGIVHGMDGPNEH